MLDTPLRRALCNPKTAIYRFRESLRSYGALLGHSPKEHPPDLDNALAADAMHEFLQLTRTPELELYRIAQELSQERAGDDLRRFYIAKGRCPLTRRLVTRRTDVTDLDLSDISESPDQALADKYKPSCAYCHQVEGKHVKHATVLSSMRYMGTQLADRFEEVDKASAQLDLLYGLDSRARQSNGGHAGRTHVSDDISRQKARKKEAVQGLHNYLPSKAAPRFVSTRIVGSTHPAEGVLLSAIRPFLSHPTPEGQEYHLTIVAALEQLNEEYRHLRRRTEQLTGRTPDPGHLIGKKHTRIDAVIDFGKEWTQASVRIITLDEYLDTRTSNILDEEKSLALLAEARKLMPFDKVAQQVERAAAERGVHRR